jgi:hypothetical protein
MSNKQISVHTDDSILCEAFLPCGLLTTGVPRNDGTGLLEDSFMKARAALRYGTSVLRLISSQFAERATKRCAKRTPFIPSHRSAVPTITAILFKSLPSAPGADEAMHYATRRSSKGIITMEFRTRGLLIGDPVLIEEVIRSAA